MNKPSSRQALIIFVKNSATELTEPQVDAPLAATYHQLLKLSRQMPFKKYIFYDKFIDNEDIWENDIHEKRLQQGTVVAEKIKKALDIVLNQEECKRAVVISSACPAISSQVLTKAFMALESHDVVLGPRTDGDYYLLSEIHNEVFENPPEKDITIVRNAFNELHSINKSVYILPNLDSDDNNAQGFSAENSL
jgi:hypothetical protein